MADQDANEKPKKQKKIAEEDSGSCDSLSVRLNE
jgi:hypothetical protein